MADVTVTIHGLEAAQAKLRQVSRDLTGSSMIRGMKQATVLVARDAKEKAPKDTGFLAGSILPETYLEGMTVVGVVGTPVKYAPFVELGSGPKTPPLHALEGWAQRHGTTAVAVQKALSVKNVKAAEFLKGAFQVNESKIEDLIGKVVAEIVTK